jgi:hypothetical protein
VPFEPLAKPISVRRRGTNVDRLALTVKQVEVETLATEIQSGVQHGNRASLRLSRTRGASLRGRPFFMAFLTMSRVSFLMCPFCVRDVLMVETTSRASDNPSGGGVS